MGRPGLAERTPGRPQSRDRVPSVGARSSRRRVARELAARAVLLARLTASRDAERARHDRPRLGFEITAGVRGCSAIPPSGGYCTVVVRDVVPSSARRTPDHRARLALTSSCGDPGAVTRMSAPSTGRSSAVRCRSPKAVGEHLDVLRQLRRFMNREVDAEHHDPQREPTEVVVASAVPAVPGVDRLDRPPVRRHAVRDLLSCHMEADARLVAVGGLANAPLNESSAITRGETPRHKPRAARGWPRKPIDAEGTPVLAISIPCHEVPAAA